jgi:hypothetical protein
MSADIHAEDLNIIGKHIYDPEKGHLIDHVFGPDGSRRNTSVFISRHVAIENELVAKHGKSKPSRDKICIQVAGAAMVGHSLGYPIQHLQVGMYQGENVGFADFGPPDATNIIELMLFREAAGLLGGFATRELLGISHPCSSIRSRVIAAIICRYMEQPLGKAQWHYYHRALQYSKTVVTKNRHILNSLVHMLSRTDRVTPEEAMSVLKDVKCVSPDWYLYAD